MVSFHCKTCNSEYSVNAGANILMICPYCKNDIGSISDYGFGPIVPCEVYVGMEKVADLDDKYVLRSEKYGINQQMTGEYKDLGYYKCVAEYMHEWLEHTETEAQHYIYADKKNM